MLAGHGVELAALFVEPHPQPLILDKDVRDLHGHRRRDPGEGEDQHTDQGAVAKTDDLCRVDAIEDAPRLIRAEDRRLALLDSGLERSLVNLTNS